MASSCGKEPLRQLEFFSGIGGMRVALERALEGHPHYCLGTVTAFDCSPHCQQTYAYNFKGEGEAAVRGKMIEQLSVKQLDGLADVWSMSPPCQPFTNCTSAKQLGSEDNRSKAFANLMRILPLLQHKPRWIFFENVKPFGGSTVHAQWQGVLKCSGYRWREYLLTPSQIGVPNQRSRYYFACELVGTASNADDAAAAAVAVNEGDTFVERGGGIVPDCSSGAGRRGGCANPTNLDAATAAAADSAVKTCPGPGCIGELNVELSLGQLARHFVQSTCNTTDEDEEDEDAASSGGGGSSGGDGSGGDGSGEACDGDVATSSALSASASAAASASTQPSLPSPQSSPQPPRQQQCQRPRQACRLQQWILSDEVLNQEYKSADDACNFDDLVIPDAKLSKPWAQGLSYVGAKDRTTYCFTSAYGKTFHKSSGSLLHRSCSHGKEVERPANMATVHSGAVRLFAPLELLRLFGFPDSYRFPPEMRLKHRFKLIGQSINVGVVECVMRSVFWEEGDGDVPRKL